MARIGFLSLLALFFMASYTSATTLEEHCKDTKDAAYCVKLLKNTVQPDTDFNSVTWRKIVISRATTRAMIADDHLAKMLDVPKSNEDHLKLCERKLGSSVQLLREATVEYDGNVDVNKKLDMASAEQEACSDSLESAGGAMTQVKGLVDEAAKAIYVVKDLI